MDKIKIDTDSVFLYPMPMVLVGSIIEGKTNFMAVGWASRVNFKPPLIAVSLGAHHTNIGIETNKEFSINIPNVSLLEKTDYAGTVSGKDKDKSGLFNVFFGELSNAPLIEQCPICISLSLFETLSLPSNTLYIGEAKEVFTEARYTSDGKPDIQKINPFTLTMPDNNYWSIGENLGKAWDIGLKLKN